MERVEILPQDLDLNLFSGDLLRGALLCTGDMKKHNCMTITWATMGMLWNRNVFVVYVRPTRHTFELLNAGNDFTVNFFSAEYREILAYCGTSSGREVDKMAQCNLTPIISKTIKSPGIDEAQLLLEVKTLYTQDVDPHGFLDKRISDLYPLQDYHRIFMGELVHIAGVSKFVQ
jgi:flavin reductase (DIM6/NTAB) family NADH-FMN oxidoreductase RutF